MKIGLFFGSFNPIHIGHLIIAKSIAQNANLDQIWFIISPQNPFKSRASLLDENARYHLVSLAITDDDTFKASNIEFSLPKPSYTIDTLTFIQEKYPDHHFSIIIGQDNLQHFHKWKNYEAILQYHNVIVYPRPNAKKTDLEAHSSISLIEAPLVEISSSSIRNKIKNSQSIKYLVPDQVLEEIEKSGYYQ